MRSAHPRRFLQHSLSSFFTTSLSHSFSLPSSLPTLVSAMAEGVETNNSSSYFTAAAEDVEFGFKRPDMYKEKLAGTIGRLIERHVFLCYGSYSSWPSRVEGADSDPLPKLLYGALKTRKDDITVKTLLTVFEGREGTKFSDGDVLIFPEMIKYRGLKDSDVDSFVEDVIVNGKPWASGVPEVFTGSHVFVCAHASRDKRCGVCGPVLIEKFEEEIAMRGLKDQVFVSGCSHVGGHKYAGNIIIFSPDSEGKIAGHWYGYVTPEDVAEMLDQHIGKGEIIDRLWRLVSRDTGGISCIVLMTKTLLTVFEGREGTKFSDGDVLIFPEMIKYRGLKDSDVDSFVEDVIVNGKPWASGVPEVFTGSHVFICAHASRDKRCGVCGPVLIEKFEEEIAMRGLKDQVFVSGCSHVGGHKYAGNIIIFSPDSEGKIAGHWYGYVTPEDVAEMLDQHIGKGEIIDRLWRGQMGVYVEPAEKAKEQKIPNGPGAEKSKKKHKGEKKVQVENGDAAGSCCQGANGVSCCSSEVKETAEVKGKKGLVMGKWEQSDVLTAVGVVAAVATVAVAYSFYKRSG